MLVAYSPTLHSVGLQQPLKCFLQGTWTMKKALLAASVLAGMAMVAMPASADVTIAAFGQPTGAANGFTLAPNASDTASTLTMTNVAVDYTAFLGGAAVSGFMNLSANSVSQAASLLGQDGQRFSGSFEICSQSFCAGPGNVIQLSGIFTDAAFGTAGGTDLTVNVSDPTESLSLSSSIIPASELGIPNSFALSLVTGSDALAILGSGATATLGGAAGGAVTYFVTGDVSATPFGVPEPASFAILGVGLLGLTMLKRKA